MASLSGDFSLCGWQPQGRQPTIVLGERLHEVGYQRGQLVLGILREFAFLADGLQQRAVLRLDLAEESMFEAIDVIGVDGVEEAADAGENRHDLLFDRHWLILALLQQLGETRTAR